MLCRGNYWYFARPEDLSNASVTLFVADAGRASCDPLPMMLDTTY